MSMRLGLRSLSLGLLLCAGTASAGAGRVHVVETPDQRVGEIDLVVNLTYDPATSDWNVERLKKLFRTTSTVLCDTTEGFFRIGHVRFVRSPAGRAQADIWFVDGDGTSNSAGGIGVNGGHVTLYRSDVIETAHELGHYVFGMNDQYGSPSVRGPCEVGSGYESGASTPRDTSLMQYSNFTVTCQVRDDTSNPDGWRAVGPLGGCFSVEDCLDPALLGSVVPVWGQGPADTVRCHDRSATEFSTKIGHDLLNGLGAGFDRRNLDGGWGDPTLGTTFREQLDAYTNNQLSCNDPACVLDHCPAPRQTQQISIVARLAAATQNATGAAAVPSVGDVLSEAERDALALNSSSVRAVSVFDRVGRWAITGSGDNEPTCPADKDSRHLLQFVLQNIGTVGTDNQYAVWFTLPDGDFVGGTEGNLRVVGVEIITVGDTGTITTPISLTGLKNNECLKDDPDGPRGEVGLNPNPLEFNVEIAIEPGTSGILLTFPQGSGNVGDCGWYWDDALTCAKTWMPFADDPQDGDWASTWQSVQKGEWDWSTVQRRYAKYRDSSGAEHDFVTFGGLDLPSAENEQCLFSQDGDPTKPKGAYDVVFEDLTRQGSEMFVVMDRSGSMSTKDGLSGSTRMDTAKFAAKTDLSIIHDWVVETSDDVNVGLLKFDHEIECTGLEADPCALSDLALQTTLDGLSTTIDGLTPRGSTALVDAVRQAAQNLDANAVVDKEKYIYVVTDGYENASANPDVPSLLEDLRNRDITIFALAVGSGADQRFLRSITEHTGGAVFYADTADFVGNAFHLMTNESRGGSVLIPFDTLESAPDPGPIVQASSAANFEVEQGAQELVVLLTNGGPVQPLGAGETLSWDLNVTLSNGTDVIRRTNTVQDPQIRVISNAVLAIRVPNPKAGPWALSTQARGSRALRSNLTVTAFNPNPRLFVGVSPRVVSGTEAITVTPAISYGGVELDANWADCAGKVVGPAGFEAPLTFTNTGPQMQAGEPPTARIDTFGGRGYYRVELECDVTATTRVHPENIGAITPSPFKHTAVDFFFVDTTTMPASTSNDNDGDGIPNSQEVAGDCDGDGFTNQWDNDSDNDDVPDAAEGLTDTDADGTVDSCDSDSDGDGFVDAVDPNRTTPDFSRLWPMFRGTPDRRALSGLAGPRTGSIEWKYAVSGGVWSSPAIGTNGAVYFGGEDNKVHALNANMTPKWPPVSTGGDVKSSPALSTDGFLYVGSDDNKLYKINAKTGAVVWTFTTGGDIQSSPVIHPSDGAIIFGSNDAYVYALRPDGTLKWRFKTSGFVQSSPAVGPDETIYVGSDDDRLYALRHDAGLSDAQRQRWNRHLGADVHSTPAVGPGPNHTIYVGSDADFLFAIRPADGQILWSLRTSPDRDVDSSPAIGADGTVYYGGDDDKVHAVSPTGQQLWTFATGADVESSPTVGADGIIYVGSDDDKMYALKPDPSLTPSQRLLWQRDAGGDVHSSPAIGPNGVLYVGTTSGGLVKFSDAGTLGVRETSLSGESDDGGHGCACRAGTQNSRMHVPALLLAGAAGMILRRRRRAQR